jgi:hypothetical protein
MRSMSLSHDMPENSEKPPRKAATSSSVAPLSPKPRVRSDPSDSPIAPPGPSGSAALLFQKRSASIALLDTSSTPNPIAPSQRGWSLSRSGCAMRRNDATAIATPGDHQPPRERPNR